MTTARAALAPRPTWFRLPEGAWALIREEYLAGATAKEIAAKWRVSPTSVYRHACQDGWTKERRGEAVFDRWREETEARVEAQKLHIEEQAQAAQALAEERGPLLLPGQADPAAPGGSAGAVEAEVIRPEDAARQALVKSAEALVRISQAHPELAAAPADAGSDEAEDDQVRAALWVHIARCAARLLCDPERSDDGFGRAARRWRAEHLGPEVAEADRQAALKARRYRQFYHRDGSIRDGLGVDGPQDEDVHPPAAKRRRGPQPKS